MFTLVLVAIILFSLYDYYTIRTNQTKQKRMIRRLAAQAISKAVSAHGQRDPIPALIQTREANAILRTVDELCGDLTTVTVPEIPSWINELAEKEVKIMQYCNSGIKAPKSVIEWAEKLP